MDISNGHAVSLERTMCRWLIVAVAVVSLAGCARPELELADGSGASWQQWQGQWLIINYWAEWCAPCRKEIPELNELHRDGAEAGVVVLGVNFDGLRGEALTAVMERMGVEFPVLVDDPRERWQQPQPAVLPSTFIVDPDGELLDVLVGPQTYESLARAVGMTVEI
jgi:thiol-disulfide isomerase/thioredoxin